MEEETNQETPREQINKLYSAGLNQDGVNVLLDKRFKKAIGESIEENIKLFQEAIADQSHGIVEKYLDYRINQLKNRLKN